MNSLSGIFALLSLLLFTTIVESRVGPGGYEKIAIEKKLMPEDLWKLVKEKFELSLSDEKGEKADCSENEKPNIYFEKGKFEPRPNLWVYDDDNKIPAESRIGKFEPRPNLWDYDDDTKMPEFRTLEDKPGSKVVGNMNPRYNGPKDKSSFEVKAKKQAFEEDFEPRPNVSVYND